VESWLGKLRQGEHGQQTLPALAYDAGNRCATFYPAEPAKSNPLAILMGQPSSGGQQGLHGGGFMLFRPTHSSIAVHIPSKGPFWPEKPAVGIEPDYSIQSSSEDFRPETDRVLEWILEHIAASTRE
jgi:hypothetical protein